MESKQISERIERPASEAYEYASNPANLPEWAPGLGSSVAGEIVFTLRKAPGMSAEEFERDAGLVRADFARLKQVLEAR